MKRVLVIGGSGYLGSHVAKSLVDQGYKVYIFDVKPPENLSGIQKITIGDITCEDSLDEAIKQMDIVYHFAGIADIHEATLNPYRTFEVNFLSTVKILDLCIKYEIDRFMYASTIYVYSEHGSFYKTSKQCAELAIENYVKSYGLKTTILRYGSLYGGRANHFNSIKKMVTQAILDSKIIRSGNGNEVRDYVHIADAADISVKLLNSNLDIEYAMITGSQTYKIKEIVAMINEIMGNKLEVIFTNESLSEHYKMTPYNFKPNVARKYVGEATHDLGQGILEVVYDTYDELNHGKESDIRQGS